MVVYGGSNDSGMVLDELLTLNLEKLEWSKISP